MKIKLFAIIMLMALLAMPVLAQNADEPVDDINNNEVLENEEDEPASAEASAGDEAENEEEIEEEEETKPEKGKALREIAKNKKGKPSQFKSKAANEHRSAVANFVQNLLDVADRKALGGIGERVREIAKQQNSSEDKVTPLLEKVKNKNKIKRFLFGTDFKATKEIKKEMFAAKKRLDELEKAKGEIISPEDKAKLEEQIKNFKDNVNNVLSEVEAEEGKFSLFGWVKKFFVK